MRPQIALIAVALSVSACASEIVVSNSQQAVIDASSHEDAVKLAKQECAKFERIAILDRRNGASYWFRCADSEEKIAGQRKAEQLAAMKRVEEWKKSLGTANEATAPAPASGSQDKMASATPAETAAEAAPVPAPVPAKASAARAGGSWIHLGAFRNEATGKTYVSNIRKVHSSLIADHTLELRETNLGTRGVFHVARMGPYGRATEAREACNTLKARGASCFVVTRR
jgi:cell division septation protein DedD